MLFDSQPESKLELAPQILFIKKCIFTSGEKAGIGQKSDAELWPFANCHKLRATSEQRPTDGPTNGPTNQQSGL